MAKKSSDLSKRARAINRKLTKSYPDAKCALVHDGPLQLLVATILSAQCTDARVNMVTPDLFRKYPTARDFADAKPAELEEAIRSTGFFRNKAKNIKACCRMIVDEHAGEVPDRIEDLIRLPGVARKTANVVLGTAFGVPGITVDTHLGRLSRRMGLTEHENPVKVEMDLCELLPPREWTMFSHRMIHHGRQVCNARKPRCDGCVLEDELCPKIGVAS